MLALILLVISAAYLLAKDLSPIRRCAAILLMHCVAIIKALYFANACSIKFTSSK